MKKIEYAIIVCFSAFFLFAGCASSKQSAPRLNKVYVTNTTPVDLLPVSAVKEELNLLQVFEGQFGEKKFPATMLSLQSDKEGIQVLMLNDMGIEIGSIVYDGKSCVMDSSFFPKQLKAEYIVLDLQNAYADAEELKLHYAKYGLDFVQYQDSGENNAICRDILKDSRLIEHIVFQDQDVSIQNKLRNYTYYLSFIPQ